MFCVRTHSYAFLMPNKAQLIGSITFFYVFWAGSWNYSLWNAFFGPGSFCTIFFLNFSNDVLFSTFLHPLCAPEAELRPHRPALSTSGFPLVLTNEEHQQEVACKGKATWGVCSPVHSAEHPLAGWLCPATNSSILVRWSSTQPLCLQVFVLQAQGKWQLYCS